MIATASDLVRTYAPVLAYTFSDEISLLFAPAAVLDPAGGGMLFNGRVLKVCSVMASLCAALFNRHMDAAVRGRPDACATWTTRDAGRVHFDARALSLPCDKEAAVGCARGRAVGQHARRLIRRSRRRHLHYDNDRDDYYARMLPTQAYLLWRGAFDCRRNSVAAMCDRHFGAGQTLGWSTRTKVARLQERGLLWSAMADHFKWGAVVKRLAVSKIGCDPRTGEQRIVTRHRIDARHLDLGSLPLHRLHALVVSANWDAFDAELDAKPTADA